LNKTEIKVQIMQFLFNCSPSDRPFLPLLKSFFNGHTVHLSDVSPTILYELTSVAKQKKLDAIITCNPTTLSKLINKTGSMMTTPEVLLQYVTFKFLVALCLSILLQYLMASIYIPLHIQAQQMLGLGFLRPTLHGNWLVKAMWEICLTYSLGLIILLWILRRIRNYSLIECVGYVVFGLSLEVIELTSLLFL